MKGEIMELIRSKAGVHIYRCLHNGIPAILKRFDNESDKREILNYRILAEHKIPTIKTFELNESSLIMEDITASKDWRLGTEEDLSDTTVAKSLARWYFTFHENGAAVPELDSLYFEFDSLTEDNFKLLMQKFPQAEELFQFLLSRCGRLRELIYTPSFTLTYNDFFWTNLVVRKDKKAALMFDYNLLGKGYRISDFRNVCWSMADDAKKAFEDEYNRLYFERHGCTRVEAEALEGRIDDVAGALFALFVAFVERDKVPGWAKEQKAAAIDGSLLDKARLLLS